MKSLSDMLHSVLPSISLNCDTAMSLSSAMEIIQHNMSLDSHSFTRFVFQSVFTESPETQTASLKLCMTIKKKTYIQHKM
jgi:hypothetical protein